MKSTYSTSEVAKIIGIHPNTVRFYEEMELIPQPERKQNGYRVFADFHLAQFKLARTALQVEILQNGLRKIAIEIVKISATGNFEEAENLAKKYLKQINLEQLHAEEAIRITRQLLSGKNGETEGLHLTRKQATDYLQISMDTLRNWELNGLLVVKRKQNGYRVYTDEDIRRLKIIRSLRCANYSLSAILRMLGELDTNPNICIKKVIDSPDETDDIISVCDSLLTSLRYAEENAQSLLSQLVEMKAKKFKPSN